jgi:acyl transferase domain-containing protein/acyl carrier protein
MTVSAASSLESIAVVGISARYPGAKDVDTFWKNLRAGKECISFFTNEELIKEGIDPDVLTSPNYVKARGIYEGTYDFDASFFGYNPREAELIDPQQRVLLECAWEAMEHAGYDSASFPGRISFFGGQGPTSQLCLLADNPFIQRSFGYLAMITSNDKDYLATRIGYKLGLRGPCITVQTACSTSLVAIVVACQNLLSYQCDMALAGGVSLSRVERGGYLYDEGGITSPDGHTRTFDSAGKGTVFSQGAGVVALKRLEGALADRDTIHAVIRGFGVNNDGSSHIGFTAPGMDGQVGVQCDAIAMAGINPETIGFVECHGTATAIGDPIEIAALTKSFRRYTQKKAFCAVGSVKTNIGHTDTTAGVAGFTKVVLALKHKLIPASLHFRNPNPQIDFENSPFFVNDHLVEWKRGEEPRRAGVNSFGVGGTNAHVILEEAPEPQPRAPSRPHQLLVWSAKTSAALEQMTNRLATHLKDHAGQDIADVAFTLQTGRHVFPHRRVLVCHGREDALEALKTDAANRLLTTVRENQGRQLCFLFPGQGAQYAGMGKQLYTTEPVFRACVDRCAEILNEHLGYDIRGKLYPTEDQIAKVNEQLDQTVLTQPAIFVTEYSLAKLLMEWGLQPEAMLGHSIGEYVAACLAEVLSLEDALILVAARGRLMQEMPNGSMLGVALPEEDVSKLLQKLSNPLDQDFKFWSTNENLSLAAVNSPSTCVVAGPSAAIDRLEKLLEKKGVSSRLLRASHAFHSTMMDPILDRFHALVKKVQLHSPKIPYVSNLTGKWISSSECLSSEYWVSHLRNTVRFSDGVAELLKRPGRVLLEVGPGHTLAGLVARHPAKTPDRTIVSTMPPPKSDSPDDEEFLLNAMGRLWLEGVQINWWELSRGEERNRIPLPTYPFQHEQYRIALPKTAEALNIDLSKKKPDIADWFYYPSWKRVPPLLSCSFPKETSWLLFLDDCGLGEKIAERLRSQGQTVFTVTPAERFAQPEPTSFTLTPGNRDHCSTLFKQLRATGKIPRNILYLWGIAKQEAADIECCEAILERTFYGLMFLAQALGSQDSTTVIKIHVVSDDLHDITGNTVTVPSKATLIGPCKIIPHEYSNLKTRVIDVHVPKDESDRAALVEALLAEFTAQDNPELVAYRGGHRWLQAVEAFPVESPTEGNLGLRHGGVYLITGGTGGIGLALAEYLARTVRAKLALVGRSAFPEKTQWPLWLSTHKSDDPVAVKIRKLQDLEKLGADVLVLGADVSNLDIMRKIVGQITERYGTIHGVIHAAGVAGDGIMALKTREVANEVIAPKVKGTFVLEEVLKDKTLDFFILCSSTASILGNAGQVDYTAANAFLDAYAHSRKGQDKTAPMAVNWDRWDEVGMAVAKAGDGLKGSAYRSVKTDPEPLDHPIFTGRLKDAKSETYITYLSVPNHWIVGEHLVQNSPTLVGTAYLELARAAFAIRSQGAVEIKDVAFIVPLVMTGEESREVRVALEPTAAGFDFQIRSSVDGSAWQVHAVGKIGSAVGPAKETQDNLRLLDRCSRLVSAEFLTAKNGAHIRKQEFLRTGKRWNSLESVSVGTDDSAREAVARLQLSPEFLPDLNTYLLHPALMDVATGFSIVLPYLQHPPVMGQATRSATDAAAAGVDYLPFSYKKVRINKPLPPRLHSYSFQTTLNEEFLSLDLRLIDEKGESIVEIDGYDLRRIRGDLFGTKGPDAQAAGESKPISEKEVLKRDKWGDHILTKEGTEVFRRILSMSPTPQIAICTKDFSYLISVTKPKIEEVAAETSDASNLTGGFHSRPNLAAPYVAPRNELEQTIAELWQSVLGIDKVGIHDGFVELGGHSLMAIQLVARVRAVFEIELSVARLYGTPTVAGLAAAIVETLALQADSEMMEQALRELDSLPEPLSDEGHTASTEASRRG